VTPVALLRGLKKTGPRRIEAHTGEILGKKGNRGGGGRGTIGTQEQKTPKIFKGSLSAQQPENERAEKPGDVIGQRKALNAQTVEQIGAGGRKRGASRGRRRGGGDTRPRGVAPTRPKTRLVGQRSPIIIG